MQLASWELIDFVGACQEDAGEARERVHYLIQNQKTTATSSA